MRHVMMVWVALAALALVACGDDGGGATTGAPVISSASLECGPFAGDGDPRADGDILLRLEVTVSDPDNDLSRVTANYDGALLVLADQGDGSFAYDQGGTFNQIALCTGQEEILIRAVDAAGNVAELSGDKIAR